MVNASRRCFLKTMAAGVAGAGLGLVSPHATAQILGQRPQQAEGVRVLNPRTRVPLSFIIDDSTCLVNLNRFAIPQFAAAWKDEQYHHDWREHARRDPRRFRPQVWPVVWRARRQGKVQHRALSRLCRPVRPGAARLDAQGGRRQHRTGPHADAAQLGHPPRDGDPHLGDRHQDRASVPRAQPALPGELGLVRREVG